MFPQDSVEIAQLAHRAKSGANWFFWIAALTLITSLIALSGSNWRFFLSLGFTQVIDGIATHAGEDVSSTTKGIAFFLDIIVAGIFALFGFYAGKQHSWAFLVGMILFGLDTLIFLLVKDWIGIAFHAYALYAIFAGYQACRKLASQQAERQAEGAANIAL